MGDVPFEEEAFHWRLFAAATFTLAFRPSNCPKRLLRYYWDIRQFPRECTEYLAWISATLQFVPRLLGVTRSLGTNLRAAEIQATEHYDSFLTRNGFIYFISQTDKPWMLIFQDWPMDKWRNRALRSLNAVICILADHENDATKYLECTAGKSMGSVSQLMSQNTSSHLNFPLVWKHHCFPEETTTKATPTTKTKYNETGSQKNYQTNTTRLSVPSKMFVPWRCTK